MLTIILFIIAIILASIALPALIKENERKKKYKEAKLTANKVMNEMGITDKSLQDITSEIDEIELNIQISKTNQYLESIDRKINQEKEYFDKLLSDNYDPFYTKIVGVTHGNRQEYLEMCYEGQDLIIKWDINNMYSEHALAVYAEIEGNNKLLGYVPDKTSKELVEKYFTSESDKLNAVISEITGGTDDKQSIGCNIEILV